MKLLFVMDPISGVNIKKDTTFALMVEACRRGWSVSWCGPDSLVADAGDVRAMTAPVEATAGHYPTAGEPTLRSLTEFDQVWMRKDPPFDMAFYYATLILEHAERLGVRVVNRPAALRAANEKAFILRFAEVAPASIVTRDRARILEFMDAHGGRAVLKPLDLMGGAGIFLLRRDDANLSSILEQGTRYGRETVMVQEFLPAAAQGDKRILMMGDTVLGGLLRVPAAGEFRGNLAVGGSAVATELDDRDREIIARVMPTLQAAGLWFVGLDVIGGMLTEVNVTSPTGIQEIMKFNNPEAAARTWDYAMTLGQPEVA